MVLLVVGMTIASATATASSSAAAIVITRHDGIQYLCRRRCHIIRMIIVTTAAASTVSVVVIVIRSGFRIVIGLLLFFGMNNDGMCHNPHE